MAFCAIVIFRFLPYKAKSELRGKITKGSTSKSDWITVLQNRVNPKINAPEISKGATERARNFLHKFEIFQKSNDIRLSN